MLLTMTCNADVISVFLNHLWMQTMSLPMFLLPVTYANGRAKCSCGLLHVCHPLAGTRDQYLGISQVARNVSIRSNDLKAVTEMQNSSHAGLSHSGCQLESSMTLSRSAFRHSLLSHCSPPQSLHASPILYGCVG